VLCDLLIFSKPARIHKAGCHPAALKGCGGRVRCRERLGGGMGQMKCRQGVISGYGELTAEE